MARTKRQLVYIRETFDMHFGGGGGATLYEGTPGVAIKVAVGWYFWPDTPITLSTGQKRHYIFLQPHRLKEAGRGEIAPPQLEFFTREKENGEG